MENKQRSPFNSLKLFSQPVGDLSESKNSNILHQVVKNARKIVEMGKDSGCNYIYNNLLRGFPIPGHVYVIKISGGSATRNDMNRASRTFSFGNIDSSKVNTYSNDTCQSLGITILKNPFKQKNLNGLFVNRILDDNCRFCALQVCGTVRWDKVQLVETKNIFRIREIATAYLNGSDIATEIKKLRGKPNCPFDERCINAKDIHNYLRDIKEDNKDTYDKINHLIRRYTGNKDIVCKIENDTEYNLCVFIASRFLSDESDNLNTMTKMVVRSHFDTTFDALRAKFYLSVFVKVFEFVEGSKKIIPVGYMISRFITKEAYSNFFHFLKQKKIYIPFLITDGDECILNGFEETNCGKMAINGFNHLIGTVKSHLDDKGFNDVKEKQKNWKEWNSIRKLCRECIIECDYNKLAQKYLPRMEDFILKFDESYLQQYNKLHENLIKQITVFRAYSKYYDDPDLVTFILENNVSESHNCAFKKHAASVLAYTIVDILLVCLAEFKNFRVEILKMRCGLGKTKESLINIVNPLFTNVILYENWKEKNQILLNEENLEVLFGYQEDWSKFGNLPKFIKLGMFEREYPKKRMKRNLSTKLEDHIKEEEYSFKFDEIYDKCSDILSNFEFSHWRNVYQMKKPGITFLGEKGDLWCQDCPSFLQNNICPHLLSAAEDYVELSWEEFWKSYKKMSGKTVFEKDCEKDGQRIYSGLKNHKLILRRSQTNIQKLMDEVLKKEELHFYDGTSNRRLLSGIVSSLNKNVIASLTSKIPTCSLGITELKRKRKNDLVDTFLLEKIWELVYKHYKESNEQCTVDYVTQAIEEGNTVRKDDEKLVTLKKRKRRTRKKK